MPLGRRTLALALSVCGLAGHLAVAGLGAAGFVLCAEVGGGAAVQGPARCACSLPAHGAAPVGSDTHPADACGPCVDSPLPADGFARTDAAAGHVQAPPSLALLVPAAEPPLGPLLRPDPPCPPPRPAAPALRCAILLI